MYIIYIYSDSVHISKWETSKYDKQMDMNWMIYSIDPYLIIFIYSKYDKIWIGNDWKTPPKSPKLDT